LRADGAVRRARRRERAARRPDRGTGDFCSARETRAAPHARRRRRRRRRETPRPTTTIHHPPPPTLHHHPENRTNKQHPNQQQDGHLGDWLVATLLIAQAFVIPVYVIPPLDRYIPPHDASIAFPHVAVPLTEAQKWLALTITPPLVALACNLLPAALRSLLPRRRGGAPAAAPAASAAAAALAATTSVDAHHLTLASLMAFALECSLKKWVNLVGKPRPDYQWRLDHHKDVREGLFSYPSGHAAEMFAVGTVLALYFLGKARVLDASFPARRWGGHLAVAALCCVPWCVASLVAMSRVAGYRHDWSDVNAGAMIGLCTGALGYLLCYESPVGERAGMARVRGRRRGRRKEEEGEQEEEGQRARPLLGGGGEEEEDGA
jgi:membrane-associated phospholipid phosphatase